MQFQSALDLNFVVSRILLAIHIQKESHTTYPRGTQVRLCRANGSEPNLAEFPGSEWLLCLSEGGGEGGRRAAAALLQPAWPQTATAAW